MVEPSSGDRRPGIGEPAAAVASQEQDAAVARFYQAMIDQAVGGVGIDVEDQSAVVGVNDAAGLIDQANGISAQAAATGVGVALDQVVDVGQDAAPENPIGFG